VAFIENHQNPAAAHFSAQKEGALLAGSVFLLARSGVGAEARQYWWEGKLSGLNTGRPGNLISDPAFRPGYTVELGQPDRVTLVAADGTRVDPASGRVRGSTLVIETESVYVGLRFFGVGGGMDLALRVAQDGELVLEARGSREGGLTLSSCETAVYAAFLLHVVPRSAGVTAAALATRLAKARVRAIAGPGGWTLSAPAVDGGRLRVHVDARPATLYETAGVGVTPNVWVASLRQE